MVDVAVTDQDVFDVLQIGAGFLDAVDHMRDHIGLFGRIDQNGARGGLDQIARDIARPDIPEIVEHLDRRHLLEVHRFLAALPIGLADGTGSRRRRKARIEQKSRSQ